MNYKLLFPIFRYGPLDKPYTCFAEPIAMQVNAATLSAELDLCAEIVKLPVTTLTFEEIKNLALLINQWEANGKRC